MVCSSTYRSLWDYVHPWRWCSSSPHQQSHSETCRCPWKWSLMLCRSLRMRFFFFNGPEDAKCASEHADVAKSPSFFFFFKKGKSKKTVYLYFSNTTGPLSFLYHLVVSNAFFPIGTFQVSRTIFLPSLFNQNKCCHSQRQSTFQATICSLYFTGS